MIIVLENFFGRWRAGKTPRTKLYKLRRRVSRVASAGLTEKVRMEGRSIPGSEKPTDNFNTKGKHVPFKKIDTEFFF